MVSECEGCIHNDPDLPEDQQCRGESQSCPVAKMMRYEVALERVVSILRRDNICEGASETWCRLCHATTGHGAQLVHARECPLADPFYEQIYLHRLVEKNVVNHARHFIETDKGKEKLFASVRCLREMEERG